jgi:Lectin C-type domain
MRDDFWVSGMDVNCDGKFHWCGIDKAVRSFDTIWMPGHPKGNPSDCVYMHVEKYSNSTFTATDFCDRKKKFLCEVSYSSHQLYQLLFPLA